MKKIGLITFHRALNYGAVLQACALFKSLNKINTENVELIDYRNEKIENRLKIKNKLKGKNPIKIIFSCLLLIYKKILFTNFLKKYIKTSKAKYNADNISRADKEYDAFITGSDQVWNFNLTDTDYNYLLKFSNKEKYSYAASIGLTGFDKENENNVFNSLKEFEQISVREKEAYIFIEKEYKLKNIQVDIDPVLLLSAKEWDNIANKNKVQQKFVLTYNVPKPNGMYELANELAEKKGIELKCITSGVKPKKGKVIIPSVTKFVALFRDAEYVITNSFHGTVFSIIFHKKFLVELNPEKNNTNSRIITLLETCGLSNRICNKENIEHIDDEINWEKVDKEISNKRKKSFEYLENIMKK